VAGGDASEREPKRRGARQDLINVEGRKSYCWQEKGLAFSPEGERHRSITNRWRKEGVGSVKKKDAGVLTKETEKG